MRNQFVYTLTINEGTLETPVLTKIKASLNINKIVRTVGTKDNGLTVVLDDFHEEEFIADTVNVNTNRLIKNKKEKAIVFSEITLDAHDAERFFNLLSIDTI